MYEKELKLLNSLYIDGIREITKINEDKEILKDIDELSAKIFKEINNSILKGNFSIIIDTSSYNEKSIKIIRKCLKKNKFKVKYINSCDAYTGMTNCLIIKW